MRPVLKGPSVWSGADMAGRGDWIEALDPAEIGELLETVARLQARAASWLDLERTDFPFPLLSRRLSRVAASLEDGPGFVTLRNLPVDRLDADGAMLALWGIGTHLGSAVSQSRFGELLGEVRDYGETLGKAHSRGYRTGASLRFHTDRCDLVALLCIRQCRSGGESRVASTPFLYNQLLAEAPHLLDELMQHWCHSRQGEEQPGELRYYRNPVFAVHEGRFTSQYSRSFIESAQKFPEVPRLSALQVEALDRVIDLADRHCFQTRMEPGDLQVLNNHVTWHSRTEIDDFEGAERKRMLYRLWLSSPVGRALPEDFSPLWGETAAGTVRGGVVAAEGYRTAAELRGRRGLGLASPRAGWPLEAVPT